MKTNSRRHGNTAEKINRINIQHTVQVKCLEVIGCICHLAENLAVGAVNNCQ